MAAGADGAVAARTGVEEGRFPGRVLPLADEAVVGEDLAAADAAGLHEVPYLQPAFRPPLPSY